jgi:hypothetical protein
VPVFSVTRDPAPLAPEAITSAAAFVFPDMLQYTTNTFDMI